MYRHKKIHYYMLDFCYFANCLVLAHIWLAPRSALLAKVGVLLRHALNHGGQQLRHTRPVACVYVLVCVLLGTGLYWGLAQPLWPAALGHVLRRRLGQLAAMPRASTGKQASPLLHRCLTCCFAVPVLHCTACPALYCLPCTACLLARLCLPSTLAPSLGPLLPSETPWSSMT